MNVQSLPRFDELAWLTLQALKDLGGSGTIREIDDKVSEKAQLTPEQLAISHGAGPQTELSYRAAWARTHLKHLGAIENISRGTWALTERGELIDEADVRGAPAESALPAETETFDAALPRVLIRRVGETRFATPRISSYGNEAQLQELIAQTPDLLPGIGGGPPFVVIREFPLPVGRADIVLVDVEGAISVCECKLQTNPQARREVIGQLVSYAGSLSRMSYDDFAARAATRLGVPLLEALVAATDDEIDPEAFRLAVGANLDAGRFRLAIVVDSILDELRDAVLYLNEQTETAVFAIELGYLADGDLEILVPTIYGQEAVERKAVLRRPSVRNADTVIVAARDAYDEYVERSAYICQSAATRTFRPNLLRLGFYRNKRIEPEIPQILEHDPAVRWTEDEARARAATGDPRDNRISALIREDLASGLRGIGTDYQVFLLSDPKAPETLHLPRAIAHEAGFAWTQHQRYTLTAALETNPATTDELAAAEARLTAE